MNSKKVVISQHRLLQYRVRFFELLKARCELSGIDLVLIHGKPSQREKVRNDTGSLEWSTFVTNRYFRLFGRDLLWQKIPSKVWSADLVVVIQENRIVSNYLVIALRKLLGKKTAYWGHGKNFQSRAPNGVRERWKGFWLLLVDWWFSYTDLTTGIIEDAGFPGAKITTLNNAIDVAAFKQQVESVSDGTIVQRRRELGLSDDDKVAIFCGSLYPDKLPELLIEASDLIRERCPEFRLIIIGEGPSADYLSREAKSRPWIQLVGVKTGAEKAELFRLADVMLNPGLLGLHILDSFAVGLPIVSTRNALHSPEISYVVNGENGVLTEPGAAAYSEAVIGLLSNSEYRLKISRNAQASSENYSLESMADNFAKGIVECLRQ